MLREISQSLAALNLSWSMKMVEFVKTEGRVVPARGWAKETGSWLSEDAEFQARCQGSTDTCAARRTVFSWTYTQLRGELNAVSLTMAGWHTNILKQRTACCSGVTFMVNLTGFRTVWKTGRHGSVCVWGNKQEEVNTGLHWSYPFSASWCTTTWTSLCLLPFPDMMDQNPTESGAKISLSSSDRCVRKFGCSEGAANTTGHQDTSNKSMGTYRWPSTRYGQESTISLSLTII